MKIKKIYLMTEDKYEKNKGIFPAIDEGWWLRDKGIGRIFVGCIQEGGIFAKGEAAAYIPKGIRPVAEFVPDEDNTLIPGDKVTDDKGITYTVLEIGKDKIIALADECLGYMPYSKGVPAYETSPIKTFLENYIGQTQKAA